MLRTYQSLIRICREEFSDVVEQTQLMRAGSLGSAKLRILLKERSYIDVWISLSGRYSYHWERRAKTGQIFRHDNAPDFPGTSTFPKHFHEGSEGNVKESFISNDPDEAIREFLSFARGILQG